MASNLLVDQDLSATAQPVKDQNGNTSPLTLSTDNVGIGTTNPETKLDISGGAVRINNPGEGQVLLFLGTERHWQLRQLGTQQYTALELASVGGGGNKNLIISTDGRVGIGTTSPDAKLDVSGGHLRITNRGEGAVLLELAIERSWQLRQIFTGQSTALELASIGGGGNKDFIISTDGQVGIGTTNPEAKLDVEGSIRASGDIILTGADCAEDFDVEDDQVLDPGTVMVIGDEERLHQSKEAYDKRVAGVLSGAGDYRPGVILDNKPSQNKRMPLALTGKVYCKVDAQYEPIAIGDLLTTSPTPGHAMKANDPLKAFGAVIGKALRPLIEGKGVIPILIALQ